MFGVASRLHGHAIFGVVSVSDTCRTPERGRLAGFQCPASVLFFFFFLRFSDTRRRGADTAPTRRQLGSDASDTPTVKEKRKFRHISGHSGYFGRNENFVRYKILTGKKKKNQNQNPTSSYWVSCFSSSSSSS